jgi:hypothetical protein
MSDMGQASPRDASHEDHRLGAMHDQFGGDALGDAAGLGDVLRHHPRRSTVAHAVALQVVCQCAPQGGQPGDDALRRDVETSTDLVVRLPEPGGQIVLPRRRSARRCAPRDSVHSGLRSREVAQVGDMQAHDRVLVLSVPMKDTR